MLIAIDPDILVDRAKFKANASDLIDRVKSSRHMGEIKNIRLPGERAQCRYQEALKSGEVEIDENILREIRALT